MNKIIIIMVLLGFAFWGTFVSKLINRIPSEKTMAAEAPPANLPTLDDLQKWIRPQPLPPPGLRDPFCPANNPAPASRKPSPGNAVKVAPNPIERPNIGIDAILPGDNPVAILRHNGETAIVRVGQTVWNVSVLAVGSSSVTLQMGGQSFVLQK